MKVQYVSAALHDIATAIEYIRERNPQAAKKLLEEFENVTGRLKTTPYIGAPSEHGFRMLVVKNYVLFNVVQSDEIQILYVRHGRQQRPWEE